MEFLCYIYQITGNISSETPSIAFLTHINWFRKPSLFNRDNFEEKSPWKQTGPEVKFFFHA